MTLERRIDRLAAAASAMRGIGLIDEADLADEVVERARRRAGFPGSTYVLALAGGTGVGKSSVLNALAGHTVSAVRAIRPTTDAPIAWLADERRDELAALLEWIGIRHVTTHADPDLAGVALLDLPDVDSVRTEHRALVDELLPRVDAIAWVVDPEKYDDERLHHYLRTLPPHAGRLRFIVNKIDRLSTSQRDELITDFRRRLHDSGIAEPRIAAVSAMGGDGIPELRAELAAEAGAKELVAEKLATDAREAQARLALSVGVKPGSAPAPLMDESRRTATIHAAVTGALAVVDPSGVAQQVQNAVLGRARRTGGSVLGRVLALLAWLTGQSRRHGDPAAYLRGWRRRGSLARAVNPVHAALVEAARGVPASSRRAVLNALGADGAEAAVSRAIDDAARDAAGDLRLPGSLLWPAIGALQFVVGAVFAFAVAWYVTLFLTQGNVPVSTMDLPVLGPVPLPLMLLVGSILVSAVLGLILSLHAGWLGRRAGRRVAARVGSAVAAAVEDQVMAGLRRLEGMRDQLGADIVE